MNSGILCLSIILGLFFLLVASQDVKECFVCRDANTNNVTCGTNATNCCETIANCLKPGNETVLKINIGSGSFGGNGNCNLTISRNIWFKGNGTAETTIDCNSQSNMFTILPGIDVQVDSIYFINGGGQVDGGCIYSEANGLVLTNSTFENCFALNGGAICAKNSVYIMGRVVFQNNFANYSGGALYIYDGRFTQFENSDTADFLNNAAGDVGGAISLLNSDMTQGNFVYIQNQADFGGALFIESSNLQTFSVPQKSTFDSNVAFSAGGAIFAESQNENILSLEGIYTQNTANYGGAIYVVGSVDIDLYAGIASENIGNTEGGFLWASGWDYLHVGVEGFNNSAVIRGAGMYVTSNNTFARFTGSGGFFFENYVGVGNQRREENIFCESTSFACDYCTSLDCPSCVSAEGVCDDKGQNKSVCYRSNGCFHGKCYAGASVSCICDQGWTGEDCSIVFDDGSQSEEPKKKFWIIPLVLIPLAAAGAAVGFILLRKRTRRGYDSMK